ncbi:hypothetical protein [Streptomyces sp. NPDC006270]|uniref:hypothetical protein n=1 Tax=Streptomyces sp. NPDC006270 TaxID=3364741 RepID=UPI0036C276C0
MNYFWAVIIAVAILAAVIVCAVAASAVVAPAEKRARAKKEAATDELKRQILADGWHRVKKDSHTLPPVVRRDLVGDDAWLVAGRSVSGGHVWLVCRTTRRTSPAAVEEVHSVLIHVRTRQTLATAESPDIRLLPRNRVLGPLLPGRGAKTGDRGFDRGYRIVSADPVRAGAAVTEQVRAATLEQGLDRWWLHEGVLTFEYLETRRPVVLREPHRLNALTRLAGLLAAATVPQQSRTGRRRG